MKNLLLLLPLLGLLLFGCGQKKESMESSSEGVESHWGTGPGSEDSPLGEEEQPESHWGTGPS